MHCGSAMDTPWKVWQKRVRGCPYIVDLMPDAFERWLRPQHLNKSFTMKKVEADMVEWMRVTDNDIEGAEAMGDEYLAEYIKTGNLPEAIRNVKARKEIEAKISQAKSEDDTVENTACFVVYGKKDINFVEMLLKENEIKFERK